MAYYYPGSSRDRQAREASLAQDFGQWDTPLPLLSNAGEVAPVGRSTFATDLPPRQYPRSRDYSYEYNATAPYLIGQDAMNAGVQSYTLPTPGPLRARDYSYIDPTEIWLIGQDATNAGQQIYALPPAPYARSRDYTFVHDADIQLFGRDFMVPGKQLCVAAAPARLRCADFSTPYNLTIELSQAQAPQIGPGKSTDVTALPPKAYARSRDYSYIDPTEFWLIGQDSMNAGQSGHSTDATALPPRPAARARDYSYEAWTFLGLIGTDFMVPGEQSISAGRPTPRCADFSTPYNLTVVLDFYANQTLPIGQSLGDQALPPSAYPRSRGYTFVHEVDIQLIGTDAMVSGEQTFALPTPNRPRCISFDPGTNYTLALDAAQQAAGNPVGQQSTALPVTRVPRLPDYTQIDRLPNLIGQDAVNPGKSTDASAIPPRGPQRAKDYTWLQSYPLHIYESLPVGDTTGPTSLPPRAYQRMRDYTFLHDTDTQLIGQDSMVVGQSWLDTDNVFPRTYPRMRDYTSLVALNLAALAEQTHLGHHELTDSAQFVHTLSDRTKYAHTLTDRAKYAHTVTEIA